MEAVRFGVVGLGVGRSRARLVTQTEGAVLEAICDVDEERLKAVTEELHCRGFSDYDEMLTEESIDVVYVLTPSGTHLDLAEKAAAAGKHVITTKPMEITVERCHRIIQACESRGVKLVADYQLRYTPALQQWKAAVEAGELGDIIFAEARCKWWRSQDYYDQGGWRGTWKYDGGGSLANQGIHIVDLFVWLCGDPRVITARSGAFGHRIETEDLTVALLELPNGRPASITTTTCHHLGDEFGVAISGALGSASNLTGGDLRVKLEKDGGVDRNVPDSLKAPIPNWPKSAVEDMVRVLRDGAAPYVPGEEGIRPVRLMEEIYTAAGVKLAP